jgi:hypothetical protein
MTDPSPLADPAFPPEPAAVPEPAKAAPPPANRSVHVLAVFCALGFLLLAVAVFYEWQQQTLLSAPSNDAARMTALEGQVRTLQQRLSQLEQRPPPPSPSPPPDLRPLEARIAALEQRPAAAATAQPDLAPLLDRITALERHATQADTAAAAAANRADRALRIEAATAALAAGQPLGTLPDAPAALTRFATEKPPTLAEIRLAFPAAARRAADASRPATASQSMAERMWLQIASMVTIRSGDRVILGAPAGVVLDAARERLDAGDISGAVTALDALDPGAAQAMADWRARAQSLLDARAALASLAHG